MKLERDKKKERERERSKEKRQLQEEEGAKLSQVMGKQSVSFQEETS